jgi:outer membrane protein assembly factor BamB
MRRLLPLLLALCFRGSVGADERPLFGFAGHNPDLAVSQRFYNVGIRWLRADMGWPHLEPEPGKFDFASMDDIIAANLAAGLNVLGLVGYSPGWASGTEEGNRGSEVDLNAWRRFIATTVNRYQDRIRYWEIWNEPNIPPFWVTLGDPVGYARLLEAAYEEIKAIDPTLQVVFGGVARPDLTFISEVCAQTGGQCFDILAYHPYSFAPEAQMRQDAERMREMLAQYGRQDAPLWLTEDGSGWDFLLRNYAMALAADIGCLFTYDDTFHQGAAPEIDKAYGMASSQLGQARYLGALETLTGNEVHVLEDKDGPFLVAWTLTGDTQWPVPGVGESLRVIAWDGQESEIAVVNGRARLPLTKAGAVFRGRFPQALALRAALSLQTLPVKPLEGSDRAQTLRGRLRLPTGGSAQAARLRPLVPKGWRAEPEVLSLMPAAGAIIPVEFRIVAPADAATAVYPLRVRATFHTSRGTVASTAHAQAWVEPRVKWTYFIGQQIQCSPTLAQLDSDPQPEILLGADDRLLHAIDGDGNRLWALDLGARQTATIACADLDGDGRDEIVVPQNDREISLVDDNGSLLWTRALDNGVEWGGAALADLNKDGKPEALTGDVDGRVYCLDAASGELLWKHECGGSIQAPLAVGNVDDTPELEIVAPAGEAGLVCLRADGSPLWAFNDQCDFFCGPLILDADSDGQAEVVCGCSRKNGHGLYCLSGATGQVEWFARTPGHIDATLACADMDADGRLDLVFVDNTGWVFCLSGARGGQQTIFSLDGTGQERWRYRCAAGADSAPAIAEVSGDGRLDVLVGNTDRSLYCIDNQGKLEWQFRTDMKISASPAVADLDGDGLLEILVPSRDGKLYCLSSAGRGPAPWPTKRGSPAATGYIGG